MGPENQVYTSTFKKTPVLAHKKLTSLPKHTQ